MKLYFKGHDYRYAVEQILLMSFPAERPEYPEAEEDGAEDTAYVSLSYGGTFVTAHTVLLYDGRRGEGFSRTRRAELTDKLVTDRLLQKIIKLSFYKAAVGLTGHRPAWGALTGIRPGKIVSNLLEGGKTSKEAESVLVRDYFVSPERASLCSDTARAGLAVKQSLKPEEVCLYVGIPFCPTRCAYCSFVSHSVEKSMKLIEPFLQALQEEILATAAIVRRLGLRIISVYIGGGTPTTLSAPQLAALIASLRDAFDLRSMREFTVEAGRPDTITPEKLEALKAGGVTRISINPQTMSDSVLEAIGRRHTARDVLEAYGLAREAGFESINTDLIAGLPTDTAESFQRTLDTVLELDPENITIHTLALKRGTRITLEKTELPSGGDVSRMLDYAAHRLRERGYAPYYLYRQKFSSGGFENVGWCKRGQESLYNICIMEELCTILALGGGGSTKLVAPEAGRIERIFNAKYPHEYVENLAACLADKEKIPRFYEEEHILPAGFIKTEY